ncbi:MAG TPA: lipocalin-like domain-containing protein [Longimicrobiales bacterium]|nr:lipocalin-like domain-containing protein [Longimicrobiales bacterium]
MTRHGTHRAYASRAVVLRLLGIAVVAFCAACDARLREPPGATLSLGELLGGADTLHARAVEPRDFAFPEDHGPHPEFRTEWWYFTGNLTASDGRELGYQLTFFRSALTDSASYDVTNRSGWRARHAYMAHFAVTDGGAGELVAAQKFSRGALGLAGATFSGDTLHVWLEDWNASSTGDDAFPLRLRAEHADIAIDLIVERGKPVVLQGQRGLSRKGAAPGNASYYYSLTRMPTHGSVRTSAGTFSVSGTSWLDREWSTSVLSPGVVGWDWLSLQLNDSTELMMYRLRRADGTVDPFSAATFVDRDGTTRTFAADGFTMIPVDEWRASDGVTYPVAWEVAIPQIGLALDVATPVADQELDLAVRYWEGMVRAHGTRGERIVSGRGYLEMTGYAAPNDGRTR